MTSENRPDTKQDARYASPLDVADEFLADTQFAGRWWKGDLYEPSNGGFARADSRDFESRVFEWCGKRYRGANTRFAKEVVRALEARRRIPAETNPSAWLGDPARGPRDPLDWITVANGIVDVSGESPALISATSELFCLSPLPVAFDPAAKCPRFECFLKEILEGDFERINLVQEFAGYLLTPWTGLEKFLVCHGGGANGKSVLLDVLSALLGASNVSAVPIQSLCERFQSVATIGKLANITHELDRVAPPAEEQLKAFISGDPLTIDRKNQSQMTFRPTARIVIATNALPNWNDKTGAIFRRQFLIPFRVTISPEKQDSRLASRIISEELPGVLNWAIRGLFRLRRTQGFTKSELASAAQADHRREANSADEFLRTHCVERMGASIDREVLRKIYEGWCESVGATAVSREAFGTTLKAVFPKATEGRPRYKYPLQANGKPTSKRTYQNIALMQAENRGAPSAPGGIEVSGFTRTHAQGNGKV